MTPIEKYTEWLASEALSYKQMRDGWKEHSFHWETYDLMVRQLSKELDKLESILPAEREAIIESHKAGQENFKERLDHCKKSSLAAFMESYHTNSLNNDYAQQYFNETFKRKSHD